MNIDLSPLQRLLDQAAPAEGRPLPVFLRDDDAGWADDALQRLLQTTAEAAAPLDLAVIPQALGPALAEQLCRHHAATGGRLGLHQHGWAHLNHQPDGRRCEFGPAREPAQQQADLAAGRQHLLALLGPRLDPIFTPPWNRCAAHTPALLPPLGIRALSRDRGAPAQTALPELPVDLDWTRQHRAGGAAAVVQALAQALQQRLADGRALGLMLHHAVMEEAEWPLLARLLRWLGAQPQLRLVPMRSLLPG